VQRELEGGFLAEQAFVEQLALKYYNEAPRLAVDYLTRYSVDLGNSTVQRWKTLGEALLVKYMDGNVKDELGKVTHPPHPQSWYRRIVDDTGDHFRMIDLDDPK